MSNGIVSRQRIDKVDFMRQYFAAKGDVKVVADHYHTTKDSVLNRARAINRALAEGYEEAQTPEDQRFFLPIPRGGKPGAKASSPADLVAIIKQLSAGA